MQALTINALPEEVLSYILQHVRQSSSPASFVSCLVCCRTWHEVALREHHRDIVLGVSGLGLFLEKFRREKGHLVKSLTITIDPSDFSKDLEQAENYEEVVFHNQNGLGNVGAVWRHLQCLPGVIRTMSQLSTFSFVVGHGDARGFWLSRPLLGVVIKALPETCINLEIDTGGCDQDGPGSSHLCEILAGVIPRLHHLRLRLRRMCPALFGADMPESGSGSDSDSSSDSDSGSAEEEGKKKSLVQSEPPSQYPFLETAMINCCSDSYVCTTFMGKRYGWTDYYINRPEARTLIAEYLGQLDHSSSFPHIKRLWLLDLQREDSRCRSMYSAYNRRDIIRNKTWTIPYHPVKGHDDGSLLYLIRTPDNTEVLAEKWVIESLAEGEMWKETLAGAKVPSALLIGQDDPAFEGRVEKPLPTMSVAAYRSRTPHSTCCLWHNEEKTGTRLLSAIESDGVIEKHQVVELTPPGWRRQVYDAFSSSLERDGLFLTPLQ
ncbi:hypothetical protein DTO195F2_510 [Paecilomyces variotii]|nr:hypothetical protein DTO195F2_510 [Paecilomyces variotii]KAJ9374983.1 hypothetical protein DTO282E5_538 [Paecilomyces variotii]